MTTREFNDGVLALVVRSNESALRATAPIRARIRRLEARLPVLLACGRYRPAGSIDARGADDA